VFKLASKIKHGVRLGVQYMIAAFLTVVIGQILLYFGFGDSIPMRVIITFVSIIIAVILIYIASSQESGKVLVR